MCFIDQVCDDDIMGSVTSAKFEKAVGKLIDYTIDAVIRDSYGAKEMIEYHKMKKVFSLRMRGWQTEYENAFA